MTDAKTISFALTPMQYFLWALAIVYTNIIVWPAAAAGNELFMSQTSRDGHFVVSIEPEDQSVEVGPIHNWVARISDPGGGTVAGASVSIDGGMPGHGHGLPTAPEVTGEPEPGLYRIEGVKFSMVGVWELRLQIETEENTDTAVFEFQVE